MSGRMRMKTVTFKDPLGHFHWGSLYASYDGMCRGFDAESPLLAIFEPERPSSDRALYYRLIDAFAAIRTAPPDRPLRRPRDEVEHGSAGAGDASPLPLP